MFFLFFLQRTDTGDRSLRYWHARGLFLQWCCAGGKMLLKHGSSFFHFSQCAKMLLGNQGRPNWQDLWAMGRKTKIKRSKVWRFILLPHTIKEVCTTLMLYLTKTEREERRKILLPSIGAPISFFPPEFVFLEMETEKKCLPAGVAETQRENLTNWLRGKESENSWQRKQKNKRQGERKKKRVW